MRRLERTAAAATRAKEHMAAAQLLLAHGFYAQAYAHATLALEETAVYGARLLTESGLAGWDDPPLKGRWTEADLARPGNHRQKLGLGLSIASTGSILTQAVAGARATPATDAQPLAQSLEQVASKFGESLAARFSDPVMYRFLREGHLLREAAFYSTPRNSSSPDRPDETQAKALVALAAPFVDSLQLEFPDGEELSKVKAVLDQLMPLVNGSAAAAGPAIREALKRASGSKLTSEG
jgi:AbiV